MKAIIIPVGAMPRAIEIEGLKDLQRAVGGCIEACGWVFNDSRSVERLSAERGIAIGYAYRTHAGRYG